MTKNTKMICVAICSGSSNNLTGLQAGLLLVYILLMLPILFCKDADGGGCKDAECFGSGHGWRQLDIFSMVNFTDRCQS